MSVQSSSSAVELSEEILHFFEEIDKADSRMTEAQKKTFETFKKTIASLQTVENSWADWLITLTNEENSLRGRITEKKALLETEKKAHEKDREHWNTSSYRWQREVQGKVSELKKRQEDLSNKYDQQQKSHEEFCKLKRGGR